MKCKRNPQLARDITGSRPPVLLLYNLDPTWDPEEREAVIEESTRLGSALGEVGHSVTLLPVCDIDFHSQLTGIPDGGWVVLNWCESIPGMPRSEAQVAAALESMNLAYTGSASEVLALSEDKHRMKEVLATSGIPTPTWRIYDAPESEKWHCFPAIVKAANGHCSEGLTPESVAMTEEELLLRIEYVLDTFDGPALVEDFIDGREFHVSLWGNRHVQMLPPAEMDFSSFGEARERLCTYDAKFVPDSGHYKGIKTLLPAPLTEREYRKLRKIAVSAYEAIGCRDYGRIDIRLRDGIFYVLDVNPNADIGADASMACAAELRGYSYGEMGSILVQLAARRHSLGATPDSSLALALQTGP
ncbi:MAG: ATP-grasp domain-containing protein [bacterium]